MRSFRKSIIGRTKETLREIREGIETSRALDAAEYERRLLKRATSTNGVVKLEYPEARFRVFHLSENIQQDRLPTFILDDEQRMLVAPDYVLARLGNVLIANYSGELRHVNVWYNRVNVALRESPGARSLLSPGVITCIMRAMLDRHSDLERVVLDVARDAPEAIYNGLIVPRSNPALPVSPVPAT
ncbi:MAG: hypothetical protein JWP13_350 [Candidatus Saccharibacteria bacterium]|nr:hypothetical protein [Candidatus Saccharibacteria bacterium]